MIVVTISQQVRPTGIPATGGRLRIAGRTDGRTDEGRGSRKKRPGLGGNGLRREIHPRLPGNVGAINPCRGRRRYLVPQYLQLGEAQGIAPNQF